MPASPGRECDDRGQRRVWGRGRNHVDPPGRLLRIRCAGRGVRRPGPVGGRVDGDARADAVSVQAGTLTTIELATTPASAESRYDGGMSLPVALVQLDATGDVDANIAARAELADEAAAGGARLVALPEYLQFRGATPASARRRGPIPGPSTRTPFVEVARAARRLDPRRAAWPRPRTTRRGRTTRACSIGPDGSIAATYRKIHLFDVAVDAGPVDTESARVTAGDDAGRRRRRRRRASACRSATTCGSRSCTGRSRWPAPRS